MNKITANISYRSTINACYIGNIVQATVVNLTPILFIPLKEQFGFSYSQLGFLILLNFLTQVLFDLSFSGAVDKHGFRPFIVVAHIMCVVGFVLFAFTPFLFKGNEFIGFAIATFIFSGSGGLLELLLSPIVDNIPTDEKEKAMTILHSFYAWGQVTVVLLTTVFLFVFGKSNWPIIVLLWSVIPLINAFLFSKVPLAQKLHASQIMKIKDLIKSPIFITAFMCIVFGGASELVMSQWSSAFFEKGMELPKVVGDIIGMSGFAFMMGIGRLTFGLYADKLDISKMMIYGSFAAFICYLIVGLSNITWLSVLACAMCGLFVSLLWPCTLLVASDKLPFAGASMFALLAAGGDFGCSIGPATTGFITDMSAKIPFINNMSLMTGLSTEQLGLKLGILLAAIFPLLSFISQLRLKRLKKES